MFNTKEEFILALTTKRKFKTPSGDLCYYDNKLTGSPFRIAGFVMEASFNFYNNVTEVFANWYEDPTSVGKLCWFWNSDNSSIAYIATFSSYANHNKHYYTKAGPGYRYARLLTPEELSLLGSVEQIKSQ